MDEKIILLVDDHQETIRVLGRQLKEAFPNYSIVIARNGIKGYEIALKRIPDLILMDWEMPEMSGIEATRKLQSHRNTKGIPVIMATGKMTSSQDLQEALSAGAIDYVRKPIDFVELCARMNTAFRIKKQEETIKELLQNEIDLKTRQLTSSSMLVVEKNNVLQNYYDSLVSIKSKVNSAVRYHDLEAIREEIRTMNQQIKALKTQLDVDDSWLDFKKHFEEVHPTFFEKLLKLYGDVSFKDLKLCAYIRLGMEVKEMAQLLNITPGSIRTAIYRLKKKIKLDKNDSFRDFILKLS